MPNNIDGSNDFALLNQHLNVSHETYQRLSLYHDLLLKWQSKVNLISPDTMDNIWHRHILDSLQLVPLIDNLDSKIIDLGSGAGFPGMVLAIYGASNVHCIESDMKKIIFLREAARITKTKITLHHGRIEDNLTSPGDIITSRACSPLDLLLDYASNYVSHETICLFHKGKNYAKEIDDADLHWQFILNVVESITDAQSAIVKLTSILKR